MNELINLLKNPELSKFIKIEVSGESLLKFANHLINESIKTGKELAQLEGKHEEYLTPPQYAEILNVSLVTLWTWDTKGITKPLRIGNKKRYRRSDLEKILTEFTTKAIEKNKTK